MTPALRKELINNISLNPFNDKFDINALKKAVQSSTDKNDKSAIIRSFALLHNLHSEFYKQVASFLKSIDGNPQKIVDLVYTGFNRNYLVYEDKLTQRFSNENSISIHDVAALKIKSVDQNLGEINAISALETEIDALTVVCNLLRHIITEFESNFTHEQPVVAIEQFKYVHFAACVYYTIKTIYEDGLWNGGEFTFDPTEPGIRVTFPDKNRLLCYKAGHTRLQSIALHHYFFLKEQIGNKTILGKALLDNLLHKKKDKKIKTVKIENGALSIFLAKKRNSNGFSSELSALGAVYAFYPFIEIHEPNVGAENLSISDYVALLGCLQEILEHTRKLSIDTSLMSIEDTHRYPIKIAEEKIASYLIDRTYYTHKQIDYFLQKIRCSLDERIDLWTTPIFLYNRYYYFSYISLYSPIIGNLIDHWLEQTGYSLDKRGALFEKHIKGQLAILLSRKGYYHRIFPANKVRLAGTEEEVDLILSLKNIVLVCEVKCIKYATTARSEHNAYKILAGASTQVIRKTKFIKEHFKKEPKFSELIINKKIVSLVITNYPLFTGITINDIPIIDFYLLESYLNSGALSSGVYVGKHKAKIIETSRESLYENEDEMNEKLVSYITSPPPVVKLTENYKMTSSRFTPSSFPLGIYSEFCTDKFSGIVENR